VPAGWKWASYASPTTWIIYGLAGTQLADSTVELEGVAGAQEVGAFVQSFFDYDPGFVWWCMLIVACYCLAFRLIAVLMLRFVSYQKR
jgi:hypothetical protein